MVRALTLFSLASGAILHIVTAACYTAELVLLKTLWKTIPAQIWVRIIRSRLQIKGFRTRTMWIVTTLLDAELYPAGTIADLYLRRWQMELSFRDLKTTLGMESLRCRTPEMIEKEILTFLIAHNFLRALMAEGATTHQVPRRASVSKAPSIRSAASTLVRFTLGIEIKMGGTLRWPALRQFNRPDATQMVRSTLPNESMLDLADGGAPLAQKGFSLG